VTRRRLQEMGLTADLHLHDIFDMLPFPDAACDALLSAQVIHHARITQIRGLVAEMARILKPDGLVSITGPQLQNQTTPFQMIEPDTFLPLDGREVGLPHHYFSVATASIYARMAACSRTRLRRCERPEHRDKPSGTRRTEAEGKGPTGRAHVSALCGAGCDHRRWHQQRRASLVQQGWLDFQRSQACVLGRGATMSGEEQGQAEPGDIQAGGVIPRAVPQPLGVLAAQPGIPVQGILAVGRGQRCGRADGSAGRYGWSRAAPPAWPGSEAAHTCS
jgi:hypothetical protein